MKIKKMLGAVAMIVITACGVGCGSSSSSNGSDSMSESQVSALSEQISDAAVDGMNSGNFAAMVVEGLQGESFKNNIQCNDSGCTVNVPIDFGVGCTAGGRIAVTGSITGSISTGGSGILQIGATETITDWQCITGYIVNGDPYISLSGTFTFLNFAPSTQQSVTISGGFKWGTTAEESCQISLSTNFSTGGGGRTTGTVCGNSVDASF